MTRVYRLLVSYPPGSLEPGWEPPGWGQDLPFVSGPDGGALKDDSFRWPRQRMYLSRSGAKTGADLLRQYGAEVTIECSDPVTWPSSDVAS